MKKLLRFGVKKMAGVAKLHTYDYPKADLTATVVVFFDGGQSALVVVRKHDPHKGEQAFPGGFLEPNRETLRQAAKRELQEETSLDLPEEDFVPVDVRSAIDRDPRGHVVDNGFMVIVNDDQQDDVLAQLKAADDAAEAIVVPVSQLLKTGMAFDHHDLLIKAQQVAGFDHPNYFYYHQPPRCLTVIRKE